MIKKITERLLSKQFFSLLMIKMLIPAMATGGVSIEIGLNNQLSSADINSVTPIEVAVAETDEINVNSIDQSIKVASGYKSNMANDSSAMINLKNASFSAGANPVNLIEQTNSCGYLESEVKLPDLTFT
jgi:hypothetical protein